MEPSKISFSMDPRTPYAELKSAPWKHPSELAMARDWFYQDHVPRPIFDFASSTVDRRQDAINLVYLWQFRDPRLTHALISTAHLTDAILHDQPGRRQHLSRLAIRSIYAMNFCRFVNALVDRDVRKSSNATIAKDKFAAPAESDAGSGPNRGQSSMYAHALELGLPESFVELRHQAIHDEMPSLEVLRARTAEALEWLWERWWKVNVKGSAEPALSEWEEKHGKWHTIKGQNRAEEVDVWTDQSVLCQNCRKRKRSDQDEGDDDGVNPAEESLHGFNIRKQPNLDAEQPGQDRPPQRRAWVMHFSRGLPESRESPDMHQLEKSRAQAGSGKANVTSSSGT